MTIRSLINMLLEFDPDMEVAILVDENFFPICEVESEPVEIEDEETGEKELLLVLAPCMGGHETDSLIAPTDLINLN